MAVTVDKLLSFIRGRTMMTAPPLPVGLDENDVDELDEALRDDTSEESQTVRKLSVSVGYMELSEPAGGFSCGSCKFAMAGDFCANKQVRAYVSAEYGCCNLFRPRSATIVFPPIDALPPETDMSTLGYP